MKFILSAIALFSLSAAANNGPFEKYPYYSTSVTCGEIRSAISAAGALIVYRAPHLYSLYVRNQFYCPSGDKAVRSVLPTSNGDCRVYTCRPRMVEI